MGNFYGPHAYRSNAIPPQKNQMEELNRTGLGRSASLRLPWGNTREVVPPTFMSDDPPKKTAKAGEKGRFGRQARAIRREQSRMLPACTSGVSGTLY